MSNINSSSTTFFFIFNQEIKKSSYTHTLADNTLRTLYCSRSFIIHLFTCTRRVYSLIFLIFSVIDGPFFKLKRKNKLGGFGVLSGAAAAMSLSVPRTEQQHQIRIENQHKIKLKKSKKERTERTFYHCCFLPISHSCTRCCYLLIKGKKKEKKHKNASLSLSEGKKEALVYYFFANK